MQGEIVSECKVGWHGLAGDRRFAFVRSGNQTGFPWLTAREIPDLVRYQTSFEDSDNINVDTVRVTTPTGQDFLLNSNNLLEELATLYGGQIHLLQLWSGIFDSMDISLITTTTIKALSQKIGYELDVKRFRPNILIEPLAKEGYPEDSWLNELLVLGDNPNAARIRINRKDLRCMVVNIDPDTGKQNPEVLREVVNTRKNLVCVYGTTERPGNISVGDKIYLIKK
jgi:uncharacterized protein YcbX